MARVHVSTWRTNYRGIVPDEYIANLSEEARASLWTRILSEPERGVFAYVAEDKGEVVAFAAGGPTMWHDQAYPCELYALHIVQAYQRRGLGVRLLSLVAQRLVRDGCGSMFLWVLKDNREARAFYEALGGRLLYEREATFQVDVSGLTLTEVAYGWPNINTIKRVQKERDSG